MYEKKIFLSRNTVANLLACFTALLFTSCTVNEDVERQEKIISQEQALEAQIVEKLALIGSEDLLKEGDKKIDQTKLSEMEDSIRIGHENIILFKKKMHSLYEQKKSLCPISKEVQNLNLIIKKYLAPIKNKEKNKQNNSKKAKLLKLKKIKSLIDSKGTYFFHKEENARLKCLSSENKKIELGRILADIELTKLSCGMEKKYSIKKGYHKKHPPLYTGGILRGKFLSKREHERKDHLYKNKKHHKLHEEKRINHAKKVFASLASQHCQKAISNK